ATAVFLHRITSFTSCSPAYQVVCGSAYVPIDPSLFFFAPPAPSELSTLSLHDALPIYALRRDGVERGQVFLRYGDVQCGEKEDRSEEHTSELQSRRDLVCRLLLEKKKSTITSIFHALHSLVARSPAGRLSMNPPPCMRL